jgi:hypothetical protein
MSLNVPNDRDLTPLGGHEVKFDRYKSILN